MQQDLFVQSSNANMSFSNKRMIQLLILLLVTSHSTKGANYLNNVEFMGLGYDIILGNPHSDSRDEGFKRAVIKLSYSENNVTPDQRWNIPDNMQALPTSTCSYSTSSDEIVEMHSYQTSLTSDVSASVGLWTAKFSASSEYSTVNQGITYQCKSYVETKAQCQSYLIRVNSEKKITLTDEFKKAVKGLPTAPRSGDQNYSSFISSYGTHYASEIVMGSKMVIRSEFDHSAWTSMKSSHFQIALGAELSFGVFTGSASVSNSQNKAIMDEFQNKRSAKKQFFLGAPPSSDGKFQTWAQTSSDSPAPIQYVLKPLTYLLQTKYLSENDTVLGIKRTLMEQAMNRYCDQSVFGDCGVHNIGITPETTPASTQYTNPSTPNQTRRKRSSPCDPPPPSTQPRTSFSVVPMEPHSLNIFIVGLSSCFAGIRLL